MPSQQSFRMRFGEFELSDEELPTPEQLFENIEDEQTVRAQKTIVEGEPPVDLLEKGFNPILNREEREDSYCQFMYATNKENSVPVMETNETGLDQENEVARPHVFYFSNGQFAFESVDGLVENWIPQFIGDRTGIDIVDEYDFYDFNQSIMRDFYNRKEKITSMRFSEVENETDIETEVGRALAEVADEIGSQEFSGGNPPSDLSGLELFDEAISAMSVEKLKGGNEDEYTEELLLSGMYKLSLDNDKIDDAEARAEAIYVRMLNYLNRFR